MSIGDIETQRTIRKHFLSQRMTACLVQTDVRLKHVEEEEENYDIEDVFEEDVPQPPKHNPNVNQEYITALKDEKRLWHNNIPLPYQKKIKRETLGQN